MSIDRGNYPIAQMTSIKSRRDVIIVGKTGNGKSSLGNTLLGRKGFEEGDSFDAVTVRSQLEANVGGLTIVDTPGLFDTRDDAKKVVNGALSIVKALDLCKNPHAFLIVFNGACRITEEELSVIDILRISFGNEWISHAIVVITRIDNDLDDSKFENKWKTCETLAKFVVECKGRVARIDNKNASQKHVAKILHYIDLVSEKGKLSYTYGYLDCHTNILKNATELEKYNGLSTHKLVEQLSRDIHDAILDELKRQREIARAAAEAEEERKEAERRKRRVFSGITSLATGTVVAGMTGTGLTVLATPLAAILTGSFVSGGLTCLLVGSTLAYCYV